MLEDWQREKVLKEIQIVVSGGGARSRSAWDILDDMANCHELLQLLARKLEFPRMPGRYKAKLLVRDVLQAVADYHQDQSNIQSARELVAVSGLDESRMKEIVNDPLRRLPQAVRQKWHESHEVRLLFAAYHQGWGDARQARRLQTKWIEALVDALEAFLEDHLEQVREIAIGLNILYKPPDPSEDPPEPVPFDHRFEFDPKKEEEALEGSAWADSLRSIYPDFPLLHYGDTEFPIWAVLAPREDWANLPPDEEWKALERALGKLDTSIEPNLNEYNVGRHSSSGSRFVRDFDPAGVEEYDYTHETFHARNKHNGPAYSFDRLRQTDRGWRFDARFGCYFDSLVTSEMLEREFVHAQAEQPDRPIALDKLKRRQWLHEQIDGAPRDDDAESSVVLDGRFRAAALSVAVTMIFAEAGGGYSAVVTRRSADVRTHPLFYHVAPSGIFAPLDDQWHRSQKEFSIASTVLREYAEEIFNYKELELNVGHLPSGYRQVPPIRRLIDAIEKRTIALRYCGISVPLLTLRPEIYVLMFVRGEDWFDEQMGLARYVDKREPKLNWEYDPETGRHGMKLDLDENFDPIDREGIIKPYRMVPHAAAALHLSTQVARQIAQES